MPFVWCLGSIVGSGLGGTLADPVRNWPSYFASGTIFEKYPYLLPNLVCTAVVLFGMIVGILFLEETHEDMKNRRDVGLEAGKWLLALGHRSRGGEILGSSKEDLPLTADSPPGYSSQESSPTLSPISAADLALRLQDSMRQPPRASCRHTKKSPFTKQVVYNIISYGLLA